MQADNLRDARCQQNSQRNRLLIEDPWLQDGCYTFWKKGGKIYTTDTSPGDDGTPA